MDWAQGGGGMTEQRDSYPDRWFELHDSLESYLEELRRGGIPDPTIQAWLERLHTRGMSGEAFVAVCRRASEILRFEAPPGNWTSPPERPAPRRAGLRGDRTYGRDHGARPRT
jgi:hypothetical protein